jgi:small GTP-binding protein
MYDSDNSTPKMKVIFLGNCGVGKTSLVACQLGQPFEEHLRSTVLPSTFITPAKLPDGSDIKIVLWDTAGQERYRAISTPYYRDAQVALICYDPRDPYSRSLESVREWSELARTHSGPSCKLIAVACKIDLLDGDLDPNRTQCYDTLARLTAAVQAVGGYVTSAKTSEGLEELFSAVVSLFSPTVEQKPVVETATEKPDGCC